MSGKVSVQGTGVLLLNSFTQEVLSEKTPKSGSTGNNHEEWKKGVLMTQDRELYLLPTHFLASFKEGGKYIKVGRGNVSKKLVSTLTIPDTKIMLDGLKVPADADLLRLDTEPVYLDVRGVVNPMTKGRNLRYRIACRKGWTASFTVEWDDYVVSKETIKLCAENAGMFSGVGDGRAIGLGRYIITKVSFAN